LQDRSASSRQWIHKKKKDTEAWTPQVRQGEKVLAGYLSLGEEGGGKRNIANPLSGRRISTTTPSEAGHLNGQKIGEKWVELPRFAAGKSIRIGFWTRKERGEKKGENKAAKD